MRERSGKRDLSLYLIGLQPVLGFFAPSSSSFPEAAIPELLICRYRYDIKMEVRLILGSPHRELRIELSVLGKAIHLLSSSQTFMLSLMFSIFPLVLGFFFFFWPLWVDAFLKLF